MLNFEIVKQHLKTGKPIIVEKDSVDYFRLYGYGIDVGILGSLSKETRNQLTIIIKDA